MKVNHTRSSDRNIVRYLAFALLALPLSAPGQEAKTQPRTISVNAGRPMLKAIEELRARHGWLISFQDPPYEHPDDLMLREGAPRKHMIPRHMSISVEYTEPDPSDLTARHRTIERIVEGFSAAGAGHFRVYHWGNYSYVLPIEVKRVNGAVEHLPAMCEMKLSFPPAMRTLDESLALILPRISQRIGASIVNAAPINLFSLYRYPSEAVDEPVCALISRTFEGPNPRRVADGWAPVNLVWDMLYDATMKKYYFNVEGVAPPKDSTPYLFAAPQKTDK